MRNRIKIVEAACDWIGVDPGLIFKTTLTTEEKKAYNIICGMLASKDNECMSFGSIADYFSHSFHDVSKALGEHFIAFTADKDYRGLYNDVQDFYKSKKKAAA